MKTKKLKGGQIIEDFMKDQAKEEQQASHTFQDQANGTQPINLIQLMQAQRHQAEIRYMTLTSLLNNIDK